MDLNPVELEARFTFDFQVWRPSPTVNEDGCYSLVNNFIVTSTSLPTNPAISHVARVTPLPQDQLQFQPGDVLGFYVESSGTSSDNDNGVVFLNNGSHTSELVWHAKIDEAARTSQSGSCPYPVGTNRKLTISRHVAPVISISVTSYSCSGSSASFSISSASVNTLSSVHVPLQLTPTTSAAPATPTRNTDSLVAGVVVTVAIVCVAIMIVITILAIVITFKRHNTIKKRLDSTTTDGLALDGQVYGELNNNA